MPVSAAEPILVLSCFAIVLGAAWTRHGPHRPASADRWAIGSGLLVSVTLPWIWAAANGDGELLVIPLERLVCALIPAVVGWAALAPRARRTLDLVFTAVLAAAGLLFTASLALDPGPTTFNVSILDLAWSAFALAIASAALIGLAVRRPAKWGIFTLGLTLILVGTAMHVAANPPAPIGAPSIVLALALASPFIALAAVGVLASDARASVEGPPLARRASRLPVALLLHVMEAEDAPSFAAALSEALGTAIRADICLLLTSPRAENGLSILGGYDAVRGGRISARPLDAAGCPKIVESIELGRSFYLPADSASPDTRTVLHMLGGSGAASGLLVPLPADGVVVASLLLLSLEGRETWDDETRRTLERLAPRLGERLRQAFAGPPGNEGEPAERMALARAQQQIEELQSALTVSSQRDFPWVGLDDLQGQLTEAYQTIETLEAELARIREMAFEPRPGDPEVDRIRAELALALTALADARQEPEVTETRPVEPRSSIGFSRSIDEARQPLAAIAGYTDLLLGESMGLLGANQRKFLERIRAAVRRMEQSLASLAERARSSAPPPAPESSDLGACIEQALEVLHDDLYSRGLSVRLDLPGQAVPTPADPETIRSIISDLLTNAAAATPSGREIHLSLHADDVQGVTILAITDRGRGVAADDLHRVFTASRWGDPVQGLGIDSGRMARVRALAESIGGRAWVERDPAGGTTFFILFPSLGEDPSLP